MQWNDNTIRDNLHERTKTKRSANLLSISLPFNNVRNTKNGSASTMRRVQNVFSFSLCANATIAFTNWQMHFGYGRESFECLVRFPLSHFSKCWIQLCLQQNDSFLCPMDRIISIDKSFPFNTNIKIAQKNNKSFHSNRHLSHKIHFCLLFLSDSCRKWFCRDWQIITEWKSDKHW